MACMKATKSGAPLPALWCIQDKKQVIVRFDGDTTIAQAQNLATHFSWANRRAKLEAIKALIKNGCPKLMPQTDTCATRIASRHSMLRSLLLNNKALKQYKVMFQEADTPMLSDEQWLAIRDIEGIMAIIAKYTTLVQSEKHFMRAIGVVAKVELLQSLRGTTLSVINLDEVTKEETEPRIDIDVNAMTAIGKQALKIALLEAERRLCDNEALTLDGITGDPVCIIPDDVSSLLLDPRTMCWAWKSFEEADITEAVKRIKNEYVKIAMRLNQSKVTAPPPAPAADIAEDSFEDDEALKAMLGCLNPGGHCIEKPVQDTTSGLELKYQDEFDVVFGKWCQTIGYMNWKDVEGGENLGSGKKTHIHCF